MLHEPMPIESQALTGAPAPSPMTGPQSFCLRQHGLRPMRFMGSELCMAMNYSASQPYWHEINVYRTVEQTFVVAVRVFFASETEEDGARAWSCESFGEVLDKLEAYDAAQDLHIALPDAEDERAFADLAADAAELRSHVALARQRFGSLVGQVLYELEQD